MTLGIDNLENQSIPISSGNILYVGGSGEGNYTKIQDAINDAKDGDTVFVYSGTYYENVVINKTINLIGENKNTTIIDGSGVGDVIIINADSVNISGFLIKNNVEDSSGIRILSDYNNIFSNIVEYCRYGIYIREGWFNNIYDNFIENVYYFGITIYSYPEINCMNNCVFNNIIDFNVESNKESVGIHTRGKRILISNNTITDCKKSGIQICDDSYDSQILNNTIIGDNQRISYGILLRDDTYNIDVINNYVSGCDYGILINGLIYNISHNFIDKNRYGIYTASFNYSNSISNNIVTNCEEIGIGIESYTSFCLVTNNIIEQANRGITVEHGTNNIIIRNIIKNNTIGVEVWGTYNEIISNNLINNNRHAKFFDHFNIWEKNYWGRPVYHPKIIFGRVGEFHKTLPWINIEWTPAKEPYDIKVLS